MSTIKTPTTQELYDMIINDYKTRTSQEPPLLRRAVIKFLAWGFSGVVVLLWKFGAWQYLQVFIETAELEALMKWGSLRNVEYNYGQTAEIQLTLIGVTAEKVLAGTIFKSPDNGLTYKSSVDSSVIEGVSVVSVTADTEGTIGNLTIGSILNITNPITGIPENGEVTSIITTGEEPEDINVYRTRVIFAYKRPPQGGSASDYYLWATEVEGIDDCLVYVFTPGEVTLYPIATGSGLNRTASGSLDINPFPNYKNGIALPQVGSGQKLAIYNSIEKSADSLIQNRRPIQVPVVISDPVYINFNIVISGLTPNTSEINAGIKSALIEHLDTRKPQVPALGYTLTDARVNQIKLASVVQETIEAYGGGSFTSLVLKRETTSTSQYTLQMGQLAVLNSLEINGATI